MNSTYLWAQKKTAVLLLRQDDQTKSLRKLLAFGGEKISSDGDQSLFEQGKAAAEEAAYIEQFERRLLVDSVFLVVIVIISVLELLREVFAVIQT